MYTNEIVLSEDSEDILNQEDVQEMFEIAVQLRMPLLKDLLLGSVDFQHLMHYNFSRAMYEATERLLTDQPYDSTFFSVCIF
jgi:hypothetical protein